MGEDVFVVGQDKMLGDWSVDNAVRMHCNGTYPAWQTELASSPGAGSEFKFFVKSATEGPWWETFPANRTWPASNVCALKTTFNERDQVEVVEVVTREVKVVEETTVVIQETKEAPAAEVAAIPAKRSQGFADEHNNQPSSAVSEATVKEEISAMPPVVAAPTWAAEQSHDLGATLTTTYGVLVIDRKVCNSVAGAVEKLTSGLISCNEGICIVRSELRNSHFGIWRSDKQDEAFQKFSLSNEDNSQAGADFDLCEAYEPVPVAAAPAVVVPQSLPAEAAPVVAVAPKVDAPAKEPMPAPSAAAAPQPVAASPAIVAAAQADPSPLRTDGRASPSRTDGRASPSRADGRASPPRTDGRSGGRRRRR